MFIILGYLNVLIRCIISNKNCFVILIGKVFVIGENFKVYIVNWSKNGEIIDNKVGERKYFKVIVKNLLFIIYNVNFEDVGFYRFIVISVVGLIESEIVFGSFVIFFIFVRFC